MSKKGLRGYEGIALAVLERAIKDARSGNGQRANARAFLRSKGCAALAVNLGEAMGRDFDGGEVAGMLAGIGKGA